MSDVICITSSEDEEKSPKPSRKRNDEKNVPSKDNAGDISNTGTKETINKKRKFPLSLSREDNNIQTTKKLKTEDLYEKTKTNISNSSNKSLSSTNSSFEWCRKSQASSKDYNSDGSIEDFKSPKAGTSKYFDEIEKKSQKKSSNTETKDKKIKRIQPVLVVKDRVNIPDPADDVFEEFIKACANYEKADEKTREILEKLQNKYEKLDSFNKDNAEFRLFLSKRLNDITHKKAKFYQTISEVCNEISRRIIKPKVKKSPKDVYNKSDEDQEYTKEECKKIEKLEKAIKQCTKRIKELEKSEVEFDKNENSAYLMGDRYKKKLIEMCEALSKIANDRKLRSEIRKKKIAVKDIRDRMTSINVIDQSIIDFINSSISRMNKLKHIKNYNANPDYIVAPDYHDVLKIINKQNEIRNLQLSKKDMERYALNAFKAVLKFLKKRRERASFEFLSSLIDDETDNPVDPATEDPDLQKTLQENKLEADKKLNEVYKKYENIQDELSPEELENQLKVTSDSDENSNNGHDGNEKNSVEKNSRVTKRQRVLNSDEEESDVHKGNKKNVNDKDESEAKKMKKDDANKHNNDGEEKSKNNTDELIEICDKSNDSPKRQKVLENINMSENSEKFQENPSEIVVMRDSIETEDFLLVYNSNSEPTNEDPLQTNKTTNDMETNSNSLVEISENKTQDESNTINHTLEIEEVPVEKTSDELTAKNVEVDKDKSSLKIIDGKTLDSDIDVSSSNTCVTTLANLDGSCAEKMDVCKNTFPDSDCREKNSNKSVDKIDVDLVTPIAPTDQVNKEKKTNVVKPFHSQQTVKDKPNNSPKPNDQVKEEIKDGSSSNSDASGKTLHENKIEIEEIDCLDLEDGSKSPDSDIIIEEELVKCPPTIKVKPFAGYPKTWEDSKSSEKPGQKPVQLQQPFQQVLNNISSQSRLTNLTSQRERSKVLTNAKVSNLLNPLALNNRRTTVNMISKNVDNNINVPTLVGGAKLSSGSAVGARRDFRDVRQRENEVNKENKKKESSDKSQEPLISKEWKLCNIT